MIICSLIRKCFLCLLSLLLLLCTKNTNRVEYINPRKISASLNILIKNPVWDKDGEFKCWAVVPPELKSQRNVTVTKIEPEPAKVTKVDELEGPIYFFDFKNDIENKNDIKLTISFEAELYETITNIDVKNIGSYDKNSDLYKKYTKSERIIEITPEIAAKAQEIVGDEKNPYLQAKLINQWIIDNYSYEYPVPKRGTVVSFDKKKGDCGEYSFIFCAMMRSLGVPARTVMGALAVPEVKEFSPHGWAEFYLPEYGWIPVDASQTDVLFEDGYKEKFERFGFPMKAEFYFGNRANKRIVFTKNMNIELIPPYPEGKSPDGLVEDNKVITLQPLYYYFKGIKGYDDMKGELIVEEIN